MGEPIPLQSSPARCLTDQELAALLTASPGGSPEALARHLAGCAFCQERALFGAERRRGRSARVPPVVPSLQRALLLLVLVLGALVGFLYTLQKLVVRVH